ncbi:ABC-type transporter, periplasmic subunit (plasmid) [halophilic archaeon DL31]|nr:ABC-type transporter, periplasmic subunit [halophilic archaeon DL31]
MTAGLGANVLLAGCTGSQEETTTTESSGSDETEAEDTTTEGSDSSDDSGGGQQTFYVALPAEQPTLDPRNMDLTTSLSWKHLFYNALVKMRYVEEDDAFEFVPDLAQDYEWQDGDSGDAVLTFNLRDDVSFHNGDDLTAELVKTETEFWMNPDNNSAQSDILSPITQVSVDNETTVNFHFKDRYAPAPIYFSRYYTLANPYVREERGPGNFAVNPKGAGTGPYELAEYNQGSNIQLQRYDDYHEDDLPHFESAELKILPEQSTRTSQLKSGDVHLDNFVSVQDWQSFEGSQNVVQKRRPSVLYSYTALNHNVEPLGDKRVRKALRRAINTENFISAVYEGQAQTISLPHLPGSWWHWPDLDQQNRYDQQSAQQLLEDAGYGDGFEFEMFVPTQSPYETMGQVLKAMWSEVGITANLESIEYSAMYGRIVEKDYVSHIGEFKNNPDPDYYFYSNGVPGGKWKAMTNTWENQEYTDAVKEARTVTDQEERKALYDTAAEIWADEMPNLLYTVADNLAVHRSELQDYWISNDTLSRESLRQVSWQS